MTNEKSILTETTPAMEREYDALVTESVRKAIGGYDPATLDLDALERQVADYAKWLDLGYEDVLCVESPLGMQIAAGLILPALKGEATDPQSPGVWARVGDRVWDRVRVRVGERVRARVVERIRARVGDRVWARVWDRVRARVVERVRVRVGERVRARVVERIRARVGDRVGDRHEEFYETELVGQSNVGWAAFYELFRRATDILDAELADSIERHLGGIEGVWDMVDAGPILIICPAPSRVSTDAQGNLHSASTSAIAWPDGYEEHYYRGVSVPDWVIEEPDRVTLEAALKESNVEVRRVMMQIMGPERLASSFQDKFEIIDEDKDARGMRRRLLVARDAIAPGQDYAMCHVTCPTTLQEYYLGVPAATRGRCQNHQPNALSSCPYCLPAMTCQEAVAWMFERTAKDYKPILEA